MRLFLILALTLLGITSLASAEPFRIGVLIPLTGDATYFGVEARRGVEMAALELNAVKEEVKLFFEDDRCVAKDAVNGYRKLISIDKVDFVVGPSCTATIIPIAPIAKAEKRPVLALWDSGAAIEAAGAHVFSIGMNTEFEGNVIAVDMIARGITSAAVLSEEDPFAELVRKSFVTEFTKLNGNVVAQATILPTDTEIRGVVARLLRSKPQAFVVSPSYTNALMVKELRSQGFRGAIYGNDMFAFPDVQKAGGKAIEGVIFADGALDTKNPRVQGFIRKYEELFKESSKSIVYAAYGYTAIKLAAQMPRDLTTQLAALHSVKDIDVPLKFEGFSSSRMIRISPKLFTIKDGKAIIQSH